MLLLMVKSVWSADVSVQMTVPAGEGNYHVALADAHAVKSAAQALKSSRLRAGAELPDCSRVSVWGQGAGDCWGRTMLRWAQETALSANTRDGREGHRELGSCSRSTLPR
jgi:hypothetical protein